MEESKKEIVKKKPRERLKRVLNNANVPRQICNHLVGEKHSDRHRIITGIVIMGLGVYIADIQIGFVVVHYLLFAGGGLIHAIGTIPIVEVLLREKK